MPEKQTVMRTHTQKQRKNLPYGALRRIEVAPDGSCMFHSFAVLFDHHEISRDSRWLAQTTPHHHLKPQGTVTSTCQTPTPRPEPLLVPIAHKQLRQQVIWASELLEDLIPVALLEGSSIASWRKRMKRPTTWGDDIALFLMCILYGVRVVVHRVRHVHTKGHPAAGATQERDWTCTVEHYPIPLATLEEFGMAPETESAKQEYVRITSPICRRYHCVELLLDSSHYSPLVRVPERASKRQRQGRTTRAGSNNAQTQTGS
jgi:hypothetical protein